MNAEGFLPFLTALCVPAVLINACALFVLSTSQRLSRQLDRIRSMSALADSLAEDGSERARARRRTLSQAVVRTSGRCRLLHRSLSAQYVAICLFVGTMIAIAALRVLGPGAAWLPVALALGGVAALFASSVLMLLESREAYESIRKETAQAVESSRA
ncbi:DUF2721 domain-containing protein [bacterium]|nr:MAG: DUF2721 domain-containing protein [bacterium]